MKTPSIVLFLVIAAGLWAGNGCSKSSQNRIAPDGATEAPQSSGGAGGDLGVGGTTGTSGPDAGAGSGMPDGPRDLLVASGGASDAGRDLATKPGTGGQTGSGGKTGTGGATGTGGSSGLDGGPTVETCGYECRADASGATGWYAGDTLICNASCVVGRSKSICSGIGSRSEGCFADATANGCQSGGLINYTVCSTVPGETGYLVWQAQTASGVGPAVVFTGYTDSGGVLKWYSKEAAFPPEKPPLSVLTPSREVTRVQKSNLFRQLEAVDLASLPHAPLATDGCSASLYIRSCYDCPVTTLTYGSAASITPEMESVWAWFDTVLGVDHVANPRGYCATVGADP
jgi:hypothetical protein